MGVTLEELIKATGSLKIANDLLKNAKIQSANDIELHKALRDACIQRFEFCVELSWKTAIRVLGLETKAPNPAVREMAQNKLIDDTQIWFDFLAARNKTSHTYDEDVAKQVYAVVENAVPQFEQLIARLTKIK